MKLIIGLGNPGEKFKGSRHNVGFMLIDLLTAEFQNPNLQIEKKFDSEIIKTEGLILAKPQTFMNNSGEAVSKLVNFYKIPVDSLYVVHDDLDLRLGEYKIQKGIGPKLHNGIKSIEEKLGKGDFRRVRVGVDNRDQQNRIDGETYVLQNFTSEEKILLDEVFVKVKEDLKTIITNNTSDEKR